MNGGSEGEEEDAEEEKEEKKEEVEGVAGALGWVGEIMGLDNGKMTVRGEKSPWRAGLGWELEGRVFSLLVLLCAPRRRRCLPSSTHIPCVWIPAFSGSASSPLPLLPIDPSETTRAWGTAAQVACGPAATTSSSSKKSASAPWNTK